MLQGANVWRGEQVLPQLWHTFGSVPLQPCLCAAGCLPAILSLSAPFFPRGFPTDDPA